MIDFTKIIAGEAGQRETFEELVCQIARRDPPATALEFRRIHGAGGAGGVEAVWILQDGSEHGYQAKFYTVSRNVDWGAIDDSVKTALATHPKLATMYIAIACALTGQTQRKTTKGRPQISGWDQWENHKAKWEAEAKGLGRTTTFVPWSAPDIEAKLTEPKMVGWTCFRKVESFPEMKGELDDEATTVYKGIRGRGGPAGGDQRTHAARGCGKSGGWLVNAGTVDRTSP